MSSPVTLAPETSAGRIFVVDDDANSRRMLRSLLARAGYEVVEFPLVAGVLDRARAEMPDLVLLDPLLPDGSGHEVLEAIRADPATRLLPVVMLTGLATKEQKLQASKDGVTEFIPKSFSARELLPRLRSLVLLKKLADEHDETERMLLTLAMTIDARDPYTAGHSKRVAEYADRISLRMGLDPALRLDTRRGALFHDLGKVVIPDHIEQKQGSLTPAERKIVEQHPSAGYDLLAPMRTMNRILSVVLSHHERLDGSGYPNGLSGAAIPMTVRIVSVSDIFDALTHDRAFREALSVETAYKMLYEELQKGWWDPLVVEALRASVSELGLIP